MGPPPGDPFANGDELGNIAGSHDDWTECTQAGSGRTYYYNFDTEESQWELPVTTTLSIECPEGCGPGDMLSIEVDGETLEIAVPDGVGPGEAFEVHIGEAEPEDEGVGEEEPPPPRDFVLLVLANAHVPVQKKLKLSASTLDMLCEQVAAAVGVADAVLCSPSDAAADECMFTALEELEDKAKVMVWPATAFGEEEGEAVAAAALEEREFILMVQANEHVATNKKVKLAASTLESLAAQVADKVAMCGEVALTRPTASPAQGDFFQDLGEVDGKAKISVWPASKLRDLSAAADAAAEAAAAAEQAAAAPAPVREEADDGKPPPDPFAADDEIGDTINDTDWAECTQNSTGRVYYYNFSSEESTWEVPGLENEGDGHLQRDPEPEPEQPEQPEPQPQSEPQPEKPEQPELELEPERARPAPFEAEAVVTPAATPEPRPQNRGLELEHELPEPQSKEPPSPSPRTEKTAAQSPGRPPLTSPSVRRLEAKKAALTDRLYSKLLHAGSLGLTQSKWNTIRSPRTTQARRVFCEVDKDGDGEISLPGLSATMSEQFDMGAAETKRLFSYWDKDHNSKLNKDEFIGGWRNWIDYHQLHEHIETSHRCSFNANDHAGHTTGHDSESAGSADGGTLSSFERLLGVLDTDGDGEISIDEFMGMSRWERTCRQQGHKVLCGTQLRMMGEEGEEQDCRAMLVGSQEVQQEKQHQPTDHFNMRVKFCYIVDEDFDFKNSDSLPIDDCELGTMDNSLGHRCMVITVSSARYPNHRMAGKRVVFSACDTRANRAESAIDDWISAINIGMAQNNAFDKMTLGTFRPDAKSAIASFPGEDRHLWAILVHSPDARLKLAFDGEANPSLCCVFTYEREDEWFKIWCDNVTEAHNAGQKLLVYTIRKFVTRKEKRDRVIAAENNRSFPGMACNIKKGDPLRKLGFSQEREVAWIESQGYEYEVRPVETLDCMRSLDAAGNIYNGEWSIDESSAGSYPGGRPGVKEGFGVMHRTDGTVYDGKWKDDRPHGRGEEELEGEWRYEGNFEDGFPQ